MVDVVVCLSDWQHFLSLDASNSYTVCDIVIENMDSLLMIALCPQCRCHCIIFRPSFDPLPSMRARRLRVLYPFQMHRLVEGRVYRALGVSSSVSVSCSICSFSRPPLVTRLYKVCLHLYIFLFVPLRMRWYLL